MVSLYNQLCPVLFGPGAVNRLGEKVRELGGTKVICISDKGVTTSGISEKIVALLTDAGLQSVVFDSVLPDAPRK